MTVPRLRFPAVAFTALLLHASGANAEEPPSEAAERFERGLALFDEHDFAASLAEFRRAYALKPTYKLRYNIGSVCLELRDHVCALEEFSAYLAEGGDQIASGRREAVTRSIARATSRVAHLEIVTTDGATLQIDDQPAGTAPLSKPVVVNAGRHRITAARDGFTTESTWVEAPGTDSVRIALRLRPLHTEPSPAADRTPSPRAEPSRWTTGSFVGLGAGGALLAGAAAFGLAANAERAEIRDERFAGPTPPTAMRDGADRADALAIAANVFGAAGIVTVGVTLGLTLFRTPSPAKAGVNVTPGGIRGTF